MSQTPHGPAGSPDAWSSQGQPQYHQPAGQPPAGAYGAPWSTPGQGEPQRSSKGFFGSLFDFTFSHFVTLSFAKVIYLFALAVIGLFWFIALLAGFNEGIGAGLGVLLLGWIPALFYLILIRVGLEFAVATVRTAQNTTELAQRR